MSVSFKCSALVALFLTLAFAVALRADAAESAPEKVYLNAAESLLWHTAPSGAFMVRWSRPPSAATATLTVSGAKYRAVYPDVASEEMELSLPLVSALREENVYSLTLDFDDGSSQTALLGAVTGVGIGGTDVSVPLRSRNVASWTRFSDRAVVPVAPGASSLTVNGVEVDPALDGSATWRLVKFCRGTSDYELAMTVGEDVYSAALVGKGSGLCIVVR